MKIKEVYMDPDDWEPSEFEAEIECPYCHKKSTYWSRDTWFYHQEFVCDECGKTFAVYCEN